MREYVAMFDLTSEDLNGKILDCGGGPASFNAEMARMGRRIISCDPLYRYGADDIRTRIEETFPEVVRGMEAEKERFVWTHLGSPQQAGQTRMAVMRKFLEDYEAGLREGRYVVGELPRLPFADSEFGIALSSHLLFLYTEQLSLEFHLDSIREMLRVAHQARIFPLLDMRGEPSAHLEPVRAELDRQGYSSRIQQVPYEFQRGGNWMLVVYRPV
jgi:hypothetical protein